MQNRKKPKQAGYDRDAAARVVAAMLSGTGQSLRQACASKGMPAPSTFLGWVAQDAQLAEQYTRAREVVLEMKSDEIIEIADDLDEDPKSRTVRIDSRKWLLSKLLPRRYGDRLQLEGSDGAPPIRFEVVRTLRRSDHDR